MSFTDDENKRIEDAENRAEEEIRARFRSMLFKDDPEPEDSALKGDLAANAKQKRSGKRSAERIIKNPDGGGRKKPEDHNLRNQGSARKSREPEERKDYGDVPESFFVRPGIQWFRQDVIPSAATELSRSDELNNRRKVRARIRRVEKYAETGTTETVRRAQVSVFSTEHGIEDSIIPVYKRGDPRRQPTSPKDRRFRLKAIDNSRKAVRRRGRRNKPAGPGGKIAAVVIILLVVGLAAGGFLGARTVFDDAAMDPSNLSKVEYTVTEDTSDEEVAQFLVKNGMVESELLYKLRAKIFDADYVAGTYELSPSYSTEKIINILSGFDYSSGS